MSRPIISADFEDKFTTKYKGKADTAERYLYEVEKFGEWLSTERGKTLLEATTSDLRVHLDDHLSDYSPSYVTGRRSAISKFYQIAKQIEEDYTGIVSGVPENPSDELDSSWSNSGGPKSEGLKSTDSVPSLTPDEISKLENHAPSPKLRNRLIIRLLYNCGLRREELAVLTVDDVNRDDRTIYVEAMKSPKPRRVPYDKEYVGWLLDRWLDNGHRDTTYYARHHDSEYLFPSEKSPHIGGYTVNDVVRNAAESAGLQNQIAERVDGVPIYEVTAHALRHSYAIQAIKSGINVRSLMELCGHEDLDTTLVYLKMAQDDAVDDGRSFKPLAD